MDSRAVVLGTIELMEKKLEADVNPTERADIFQERLKDIFDDLVSKPFLVHQTVEMAIAEDRDRPAPNEQLELPPEVESQILRDACNQRYRKILDEPLSMLDGYSPQTAVKLPKGKEKRLMHFVQTPSASCRSWLICRDILSKFSTV